MLTQSRLYLLSAVFSIFAWTLLAHPYQGLWHDGVLYFGQALLHSRAPQLGHDVFFAAGSQDQYSIYAHVMAPLYVHLGQAASHISVLLTSWLLMAGAVWMLLKRFDATKACRLWGLLAFSVMSPIYGGGWVFSYGEPFVTARSFAEPLLLWSLVALLANQKGAALALQMLAVVFHPLMTLPILALSWCYLAAADRRWLWLLCAIPIVPILSVAGVSPWNGLLKAYDPYWWSLVDTGNSEVALGNWTLADGFTVVLDLGVLVSSARLRPSDAWTRLLFAVVITTVGLLSLAAFGVDAWHSVLLTQLQVWRAHWIAHLMAMALAPWLIARLWQLGGLWKASSCALALALLNSHIGTSHGGATLLLWALTSAAAWRLRHVSRTTIVLSCSTILLCTIGLSVYQLDDLLQQQAWQFPDAGWGDRFIKFAAFPTVVAPCFAALLFVASRRQSGALLAASASALLVLASLMSWDQRPDLVRAVESPPTSVHPFNAHIPIQATVYWPNQLVPVWGLLERSSHYSQQQGAGVLFNRDTALIYGPRREAYRLIDEDRKKCRTGAVLGRDRVALSYCDMPTEQRLVTLCLQPDAPDFLVLMNRLKPQPLATWQPPAQRDLPQTYVLYTCSQLTAHQA
ncbi:hypothetical protein [Roseateles sp. P5_D6]